MWRWCFSPASFHTGKLTSTWSVWNHHFYTHQGAFTPAPWSPSSFQRHSPRARLFQRGAAPHHTRAFSSSPLRGRSLNARQNGPRWRHAPLRGRPFRISLRALVLETVVLPERSLDFYSVYIYLINYKWHFWQMLSGYRNYVLHNHHFCLNPPQCEVINSCSCRAKKPVLRGLCQLPAMFFCSSPNLKPLGHKAGIGFFHYNFSSTETVVMWDYLCVSS